MLSFLSNKTNVIGGEIIIHVLYSTITNPNTPNRASTDEELLVKTVVQAW